MSSVGTATCCDEIGTSRRVSISSFDGPSGGFLVELSLYHIGTVADVFAQLQDLVDMSEVFSKFIVTWKSLAPVPSLQHLWNRVLIAGNLRNASCARGCTCSSAKHHPSSAQPRIGARPNLVCKEYGERIFPPSQRQ